MLRAHEKKRKHICRPGSPASNGKLLFKRKKFVERWKFETTPCHIVAEPTSRILKPSDILTLVANHFKRESSKWSRSSTRYRVYVWRRPNKMLIPAFAGLRTAIVFEVSEVPPLPIVSCQTTRRSTLSRRLNPQGAGPATPSVASSGSMLVVLSD
jgi:hypothetical protein